MRLKNCRFGTELSNWRPPQALYGPPNYLSSPRVNFTMNKFMLLNYYYQYQNYFTMWKFKLNLNLKNVLQWHFSIRLLWYKNNRYEHSKFCLMYDIKFLCRISINWFFIYQSSWPPKCYGSRAVISWTALIWNIPTYIHHSIVKSSRTTGNTV